MSSNPTSKWTFFSIHIGKFCPVTLKSSQNKSGVLEEGQPQLTRLKALTKLLECHQVCHRRHTWQSLREHFRKQIIPKLNSFIITSKQKQKFKDGWRGLPVRFSASF